jgi:hypothetical protein
MTTYYLNGTEITEGSEVTLNGFTYPYAWLEGTSVALRSSFGIEASNDVNYDSRYYWGKDLPKDLEDRAELDKDGNPIYTTMLDPETKIMINTTEQIVTPGLKTNALRNIRARTNDLLAPTDFYIIRNTVEELEIPADVTTYRVAVITESNRLQNAIPTVTTLEAFIDLMSSIVWPKAE